jgi:hypothetical protein
MAGILPNEGEELVTNLVVKNINADRGVDLDLVAITNTIVNESITAATLTRPTGGGYADIVLTDANWVPAGSSATYPIQTFTAGAGGFTGAVTGYAIITKGTTPRILSIEIDPSGPYTLAETDTYKITPTITTE